MIQNASIGVSSHKNQYRSGVRVGNWVEELFGEEAPVQAPLTISAVPGAPPPTEKRVVADPPVGQPASLLFSHGSTLNQDFRATMTGLHFSPPEQRSFGHDSNDRVSKTFFWGSKATDMVVPNVDPNARMSLTEAKRAQWAAEQKPQRPVAGDAFLSEKSVACL